MKKSIFIFFLVLAIKTSAQPPSRFYTAYGGQGDDVGRDCLQSMDGNYVIAGSSSSSGSGQSDFYILKLDTMGQRIWDAYLGGFGIDIGNAIAELPDSGFVITGYTNSYGSGGYDFMTIRVDRFGNEIWKRTFGGADWDFAKDVVFTTDSAIVVVGSFVDMSLNKMDAVVLKYDLNGNILWTKMIGGLDDDEINSVIVTNDSSLAMLGYTKSFGDIEGDFYFCKMRLNSDTIFTMNFGNTGKSYGTDLIQRPTNEYVVVGAETFSTNPYTVSYTREFKATGQLNWDVDFYASDGDEEWVSVAKSKAGTPSASYVRNVPVPDFGIQGNIFLNINFGVHPNIVNSFGGYEAEKFYKHNGTNDGGYICVGKTKSFVGPDFDIFFIKLDSTIINYDPIVSVNEESNPKTNKPYTLRRNQNLVTLIFDNREAPFVLELITIEGVSVEQIKCSGRDCDLDLDKHSKGMYLLRVTGKSGRRYTEKLITID